MAASLALLAHTAQAHEVTCSVTQTLTAPVPEAQTWALALAGIAAVGWTRRRPRA